VGLSAPRRRDAILVKDPQGFDEDFFQKTFR